MSSALLQQPTGPDQVPFALQHLGVLRMPGAELPSPTLNATQEIQSIITKIHTPSTEPPSLP